jgi:hypothetical protein
VPLVVGVLCLYVAALSLSLSLSPYLSLSLQICVQTIARA